MWDWWKDKPVLAAVLYSVPTGICFWYGIKLCYEEWGEVWGPRFLIFCMSYLTFPILTWYFLHETMFTVKTMICVFLSFLIIAFSDSDKAVPISLKLLNKTTNIEGSYTNLVDGLDEFNEMVYIVARKDKEAGGISIEKFRFDQNNFIDALSTSARGGATKGLNLFQLPGKTPEQSVAILKAADNWPEKYNLLQHTAGYSERVRKKREIASQTDQAAAKNPDSEEAMKAQLAARQDLSEAIKEEWKPHCRLVCWRRPLSFVVVFDCRHIRDSLIPRSYVYIIVIF